MYIKTIFTILICSLLFNSCDKDNSGLSSNETGSNTGKAGSMTKFTFNGDYLYVVDGRILNIYNVSNSSKTELAGRVDLENSAVETIFSNGTYLFFGTQNGMLIYGLGNPVKPNYISTYTHVVSCDPVVVSGNLAYVTLSTGTSCNRGLNQLEVIDISNIENPKLLRAYRYGNPKGLAIAGNYLYLCDMSDGFMVLDVSDYNKIETKFTIPGLKAYDVIAAGSRLTISAFDGVYQYDCSDPLDLKFISKINVQ